MRFDACTCGLAATLITDEIFNKVQKNRPLNRDLQKKHQLLLDRGCSESYWFCRVCQGVPCEGSVYKSYFTCRSYDVPYYARQYTFG